ncbi:hypothetical protein [Candidatus Amarolinea dominans]|uniref:hypothetical protein n=1 Tax=Candidatus Amarolinea dominans TaxID=3140696 RepID=UPI003135549F|nr:hypothetical protein [Anaerolineae bacterium]
MPIPPHKTWRPAAPPPNNAIVIHATDQNHQDMGVFISQRTGVGVTASKPLGTRAGPHQLWARPLPG